MNLYSKILLFLFLCSLGATMNGQVIIGFGSALEKPDERIEFLNDISPGVLKTAMTAKPEWAREFYFFVLRPMRLGKNIAFQPGIGITSHRSNQFLPIDNSYFFEGIQSLQHWNLRYIKNSLSLSSRLLYGYSKSNKRQLLFGVTANYQLAIHRRIYHFYEKPDHRYFESWSLNSNVFELFLSHQFEYKSIGIGIDYRFLNLKFQDRALVNNGKKIELYNPVKFRLSIEKRFK